MYYNDEQFTALAAIEHELRRAIDRNYARIPNRETLDNVRAAYMQATGLRSYPQNWGCTSCCINLLKDAGRLYFADKAEREKAAAQETAPTEAADPANSDTKPADGETPARPEKAAKTAPKSKTTKTTKK